MLQTCKKIVLVLTGLLLWQVISSAQTVSLKGRVVDDKGQPVSYASIVLSTDSLSTENMLYAITNEEGMFVVDNIPSEPESRWLRVRSMGYSVYCRRITLNTIKTPLYITLMKKAFEEDEIVITARASDMYTKGDTLVFSSNNYVLGNERNLGDVIKKMPGMEVDKKGNVTYQGKKVNKILVDGQDILSSSSGIAMNTLPPDFARSVELLANYTDDDIASAFRAKEQLALNLKSSKKTTLSGTVEVGGGLRSKFIAKSSLISVMPKVSASTIVNANNTGEAIFSIQDYVSNIIDLESLQEGSFRTVSLDLSSEEQQFLLPPTNEHARTAGLANINLSWSPCNNYKLRATTLFNKGKSEGAHTRTDTYTLPNNSFTNTSKGTAENNTQLISQYLTQKWTPSRFLSLNVVTKLDIRNYDAKNIHVNTFNNTGINALENPHNRFSGFRQNIELKWLTERWLIFGGGSFDFGSATANGNIYTDTPLLPLPYVNGNDTYPYLYQSSKKNTKTDFNVYAGAMYPILKDVYLRGEVTCLFRSDKLIISYRGENANEETSYLAVLKPSISLMKNKGLLRFDFGSYFSSYRQEMYLPALIAKRLLRIEPYASLELAMNNQHRLTLSASEFVLPSSIEYFSLGEWAKGYDNLQSASTMSDPFATRFEGSLSYICFSIYNRLSIYGNVSYIADRNTHSTVSTTSTGLLTNSYYRDGGRNDMLTSRIYASKGIGSLPIDVKISGTYTFIEYDLIRIDEADKLNSKEAGAKLDFVSRLHRSLVNFEIGMQFDRHDQRFTHGDIHSWNWETGGIATVHLNTGNISLSVSGKSNRIEDNESIRYFNDLDFSVRYTPGRFELKLTSENIFHLKGDEWMKNVLYPTIQSMVLYRRLSGYIVLSLSYKF